MGVTPHLLVGLSVYVERNCFGPPEMSFSPQRNPLLFSLVFLSGRPQVALVSGLTWSGFLKAEFRETDFPATFLCFSCPHFSSPPQGRQHWANWHGQVILKVGTKWLAFTSASFCASSLSPGGLIPPGSVGTWALGAGGPGSLLQCESSE